MAEHTSLHTVYHHFLKLLFCILLAFFAGPFCISAHGEEQRSKPELHDIVLTNSDKYLLLFCKLENSFTAEMIEGLKSGLPIQFTIFIEISPVKKMVQDGGDYPLRFTLNRVLTYDTLKESYRVESEVEWPRIFSSQSLQQTQEYMNEFSNIKLIQLIELDPERQYNLKLKAELHRKTLPMSLSKVTPFLSWWDRETDWYEMRFSY